MYLLASNKHPTCSSGPDYNEDRSQDSRASPITCSDRCRLQAILLAGVPIWVTFGCATIISIVRAICLEWDHDSIKNTQDRHLLLQAHSPIPFRLLRPTDSAMIPIASAGALLTSSDSGDLEFRHYLRCDIGRYDERHETDPAGKIGFEGFLVAITLIDRLACYVGYDLVPARVREELIRCLEQSCYTFDPFAFGAIGL